MKTFMYKFSKDKKLIKNEKEILANPFLTNTECHAIVNLLEIGEGFCLNDKIIIRIA